MAGELNGFTSVLHKKERNTTLQQPVCMLISIFVIVMINKEQQLKSIKLKAIEALKIFI